MITVVALAAMVSSCATIRQSADLSKAVNTSALKMGMTKQETELALQKKPYGIVAARNDADTHTIIEVVQYTEYSSNGIQDNYWLYYINNKLDRWERADPKRTPLI